MTSTRVLAIDCTKITSVALTGDLIFRFENSWISRAVVAYQGDDGYSHVGVVVDNGGAKKVFHAEYDPARGVDGVVSDSVCDYLMRAQRGSLKRWKGITVQAQHEIDRTVKSIGARKFNLKFVKNNPSGALYCTQYVVEIFSRVAGRGLFRLEMSNVITVKHVAESSILNSVALF